MPVFPLASVPTGTDILIDANILIYSSLSQSRECQSFLDRCDDEDLFGYVTVETLNEACHRLMLAEAVHKGIIARHNAASLRSRRSDIRDLREYWKPIEGLLGGSYAIMPLEEDRVVRAQRVRESRGLLTNDSMLLAAAEQFGIAAMATSDRDFHTVVADMRLYVPSDIT